MSRLESRRAERDGRSGSRSSAAAVQISARAAGHCDFLMSIKPLAPCGCTALSVRVRYHRLRPAPNSRIHNNAVEHSQTRPIPLLSPPLPPARLVARRPPPI
uniref:Uncharacterized protein n=1 Tax=Plectus sambesii TaxID=2011161 RepID=A0A914VS14_9BILA